MLRIVSALAAVAHPWWVRAAAQADQVSDVASEFLHADDECDGVTDPDGHCAVSAAQLRATRTRLAALEEESRRSLAEVDVEAEYNAEGIKCAKGFHDCTRPGCCQRGYTCYEKDNDYAQCMRKGDCLPGFHDDDDPRYKKPWSCNVAKPGKRACSKAFKDCRISECCPKGYVCYAKDDTYAQCLEPDSCVPGLHIEDSAQYRTPWSCKVLGKRRRRSSSRGGDDDDEDDDEDDSRRRRRRRRRRTPSREADDEDDDAPRPSSRRPASYPYPAPSKTGGATEGPSAAKPAEPAGPIGPENSIVIKGNFLYDASTGNRFFAKGIAYNPRNINYNGVTEGPKSKTCQAGEPPFRELGYTDDVATDALEASWGPNLEAIANMSANTIRLYNINPDKSHDKFMKRCAELGIYVIVPLTRMDWGYLPAFPSPQCYTKDIEDYGNVGVNLLTSAKLIVKQFSKYPNTLMFTVANELPINDKDGYGAYPCVKALTRDIHRYQASCASEMRRVPLIYSDVDMGQPTRVDIAQYLTCALESPDDAVDAYGLNVYSWCDTEYLDEDGKPSFKYSPYQAIVDDFATFEKPLLFTEFGCNLGEFESACPYKKGRTWVSVPPMFKQMGEVLSGAVAFEFSMEKNQFGVALTPGFLKGQGDLELLPTYFDLQKQFMDNTVDTTWNGISVDTCGALPSDVAPMDSVHKEDTCPAPSMWKDLQQSKGVSKVADWDVLPPTPKAPLTDVNGQDECPAYRVPDTLFKEGCCHMKCTK